MPYAIDVFHGDRGSGENKTQSTRGKTASGQRVMESTFRSPLTARILLDKRKEEIRAWILQGYSTNQIMRKARCTADHVIRKWIKENYPDLVERVRENGKRRMKEPSKCVPFSDTPIFHKIP